ncbi:MAG: sugar ABC transporter ATP-binding protein [Clostridia bacterium]|nr:sugar ABC transporter ATP-binding protein [Clostridia bacterium]
MEREPLVQMEEITVEFPGVLALNKVPFTAYGGEVHVLLGENGAGKSTIMKVLAGVNTNYSGRIVYKGQEIRATSVEEQRARGVSIIFQEMNLLKNLTVAENIYMGRHPMKVSGQVDWNKMNADARSMLDMIHSDISEKALIADLSVGQMQMVEIAKALSFKSDIIIMDEPTSALTEKEVDALFEIIAKLKAQGVAIVYISHRLAEIMRIGDKITILRDGQYIDTLSAKDITVDKMIQLMVGRDISEQYPKEDVVQGPKLLEVKHLNQGKQIKDVSFHACAGEIVGFYGLMGAGRTEVMRAVFGADPYDSGEIKIHDKPVKIKSCEQAKRLGIALLTEDRKNQGLILEFSVKDNIGLAKLDNIMNNFGINAGREKKVCDDLVKSVKVKTPSNNQKVKLLSGGNQQKVVIAKWLNTNSDIIIFDEPTRGIDVGAKVEIYRIMNELKKAGKSVIMISSELPETIGVSDRIYVMHEGRITAAFDNEDVRGLTEDYVIAFATGTKTHIPEQAG